MIKVSEDDRSKIIAKTKVNYLIQMIWLMIVSFGISSAGYLSVQILFKRISRGFIFLYPADFISRLFTLSPHVQFIIDLQDTYKKGRVVEESGTGKT